MSTVFELGSFVGALNELALQAEVANARPRVWTQLQKESGKGGLDPQALFFDSESRGVASSGDQADNHAQAAALATQTQLMKVINQMQTTSQRGGDQDTHSFSGGGGSSKLSHVPPEVAPSLLCIPKVWQQHHGPFLNAH
jgi:hypothetical protein